MLGVGIDIIEVSRIKEIINSNGARFLNRIFTDEEILYCSSKTNIYERFSGRFAAKEAVKKALSKRIQLSFKEIEILNDDNGLPFVEIKNDSYAKITMHISISHISEYATSIAIAEN